MSSARSDELYILQKFLRIGKFLVLSDTYSVHRNIDENAVLLFLHLDSTYYACAVYNVVDGSGICYPKFGFWSDVLNVK